MHLFLAIRNLPATHINPNRIFPKWPNSTKTFCPYCQYTYLHFVYKVCIKWTLRFNTFPLYVSYENNLFLYEDLRAKTRGKCVPLFVKPGENVSPCLTSKEKTLNTNLLQTLWHDYEWGEACNKLDVDLKHLFLH